MKDIIGLIVAIIILFGGCSAENMEAQNTMEEYVFSYQETQIAMHAEATPILEILGEPISCTEQTSCAFDGMDKTYYYGSFYISTYPDGDSDRIYSVWFSDDTVATEEDIRIGDTIAEVERIYALKADLDSREIVLQGNSSRLRILLKDQIVTSIIYEAI